jgi:hypothetical protein
MAEPLPATEPVAETVAYKPLSGFAIAGLALACLFAVLVLVSAAVALVQGVPFFFTPWLLLVAGAGLVLSFIAQSHIRNSEGTRAGLGLARAGLWISLLSGLGYFAYYYVTGLALTNQANAFLMEPGPDSGFFAHLKNAGKSPAELNAAFLLTLPASNRGSTRPEDEAGMVRTYDVGGGPDTASGPLSQFRQTQIVALFTHGNAGSEVEPLGVVDWSYENRSYQVQRNYRIHAPEATADVTVTVRSTEGEAAGQVRKWYVVLQQTSRPKVQLTTLGQGVQRVRSLARAHLDQWQRRILREGQPFPEIKTLDTTNWEAAGLPQRQVPILRDRIRLMFDSPGKDRFNVQFGLEDLVGNWERDADGRMHFLFPFKMMIPPIVSEGSMAFSAEGMIGMHSTEAVDPLRPTDQARWQIDRVFFTHVGQMKKVPGSQ